MSDDDIFEVLQRAVGPDATATPSADERAALRRLVVEARAAKGTTPADATSGGTSDAATETGAVAPVVAISSARRWRHRAAVGTIAVIAGVTGVTAVAAAANNGVLPEPVRRVVHAVGIPVDSVALAETKDALHAVRTAKDADLARAITRVERALAALSTDERAGLASEAERTLSDARARLAQLPPTTGEGGSPSTTAKGGNKPATTSGGGSGSGPSTSVDDHGGGGPATSDGSGGPSGSDGTTGRGGPDTSTAGSPTSDGHGGGGSGGGDSTTSTTSKGGGDSTTSTASSGSGKGGGGGGGGGGASTSTSTSTTAKSSSSTVTSTTVGNHGGGGSGGGGSGGGGSGGGGGGSNG